MITVSSANSVPSAARGRAGWLQRLARPLTRWWLRAPDGGIYQRRRGDAVAVAAGLCLVVACGVLVANRLVVGTDLALFRRINHWPGWLYPLMWPLQLPGVIGALPLLAAAAALARRLRLAAGLGAAALLKVSLEAAVKTVVHRDRPAASLSDVILRGNSAAHGLGFPSGHAMVIFAIAALVAPYVHGWWKILPWALAVAVCLSRVYLGAHFPMDIVAGAALGIVIGGVLNLVFGVPSIHSGTSRANGLP